ncbi:MAG: ComEA family DNA-binding protein [Myxococcota bacterium]
MICAMRMARAPWLVLLVTLAALAAAAGVEAADESPRLSGVVNVNTATVEELQLLPGIGQARASALISERKQRGGFKTVEELIEVKGIGETGLQRLRPYVSLTGKTTARRR